MGQREEDEEKNYRNAIINAGLMQQYLTEAMSLPEGDPKIHEWFKLAFTLKSEIEADGFPVDYAFHFIHGHNDPDGNSTKLASVTIHRPSKNITPATQADYDRWFRRQNGIADDDDEKPPKNEQPPR